MDRFRSMGCEIAVGGATPRELAEIRTLFEERDERFSRFRDDSELARVNASRAPAVMVSTPFAQAVDAALAAGAETDGLVDPTLLAALENAGYDADFAALDEDPGPPGPAVAGRGSALGLVGRVLTRPPGLRLDLAGVVKAMAVDDALALLSGPGWVSAGGDVATRGAREIGLPGGGAVRLERGALATSGCATRRWRRGGAEQHHLIDPRTGLPAVTPWLDVTVCAASCLAADVAAKAAFLLGHGGPAWLAARGLCGRFRTPEGELVRTADWPSEELACT